MYLHTIHTDSSDDSFLKLSLLVLLDDLGADVGAVVRSCQLIVHAEPQVPEQCVKNFQNCGTYNTKTQVCFSIIVGTYQ